MRRHFDAEIRHCPDLDVSRQLSPFFRFRSLQAGYRMPVLPYLPNTQILSAAAVQRIYLDATISNGERSRVLDAAYYRARVRGQGSLPEFSQEDCDSDFIEAAGDFLSNI